MKIMKYIKLLSMAFAALLVSSCMDQLDTYPEGGTITQDQKDEISAHDPSKLDADLQGMYSSFTNAFNTFGRDANIHFDYSYPAIMMILENCGADMVSEVTGYNWFSSSVNYTAKVYNSEEIELMWNCLYSTILAANAVIKSVDAETEDVSSMFYLGQAKAMRAFCYFQLAQIFQYTYQGNEEKPCVPIITETSEGSEHPRKTVKDVYTLIMDDLNAAVPMLQAAAAEQLTRVDKAHIDYNVACGIRARVNLVMGNYKDAYNDAQSALGSTYRPYSKEDVSVPAFNDASASSWIWGLIYTSDSYAVQTGIVNWPSHLCSMSRNSYTCQGVHRMINSNLWAEIPESDVRKGWWVNEDLSSPLTDNLTVDGTPVSKSFKFTPYTNVKFGSNENDPAATENAQDYPMMRAEEMYLIMAEARAMSGDAMGGAEELTNFVNDYRDPDYVCNATTAEDVREAVWQQRRIELWGEGFYYFDIVRLKKTIDRSNSNFETSVQFVIGPNDPNMIFRLPQSEIESNTGIDEDDNNESAPLPTV